MLVFFYTLPLIFTFINIYLLYRRESITWNIKKGQCCYFCKQSFELDENTLFSRIGKKEYPNCCTQCQRDVKISSLNSNTIKYKYQFRKWIIFLPNQFFVKFLIIPIFILITTYFILLLFSIKSLILPITFTSLSLILGLLQMFKILYTSTKKP